METVEYLKVAYELAAQEWAREMDDKSENKMKEAVEKYKKAHASENK